MHALRQLAGWRVLLLTLGVALAAAACDDDGGTDPDPDAADATGDTTADGLVDVPDDTDTTTGDPECGNAIVEAGEQCDDGNTDDTDSCLADCTAARCGDGVVQGSEACDDGNLVSTDTCLPDCTQASCGDGVTGPGEGCDDGNDVDTDACTNACAPPTCGDGAVQAPEACDDGNDVDTDDCLSTCVAASCGDGVAGPGEDCDDAGASASCNADCTSSTCGDGVVNAAAGEQCDVGGGAALHCDVDCTFPACGDGELNTAAGEMCDDGNTDDGDSCTSTCLDPTCTNGLLDGDESDVDCGGSCPACDAGEGCMDAADCGAGASCDAGACLPAASCGALLAAGATTSGVYEIDVDGAGGEPAIAVFCEMDLAGGGWTRIIATDDNDHDFGQRTADIVSAFAGVDDAVGVYEAFGAPLDFNQILLVQTDGDQAGEFAAYSLVEDVTGRSVLDILRNDCALAECRSGDDAAHDGARVTRPVTDDPLGAWTSAYSGELISGGLQMLAGGGDAGYGAPVSPDYFFMCGVNESSDNDQAVLSFGDSRGDDNYWGDSWRGTYQIGTLWSFWNGDYHYCPSTAHIGNDYGQAGAGYRDYAGEDEGETTIHTGSYAVYIRSVDACSDGLPGPGETGIDCGGTACGVACPVQQGCEIDSDCLSNLCDQGLCVESHCLGGSQDADETDIDCGGSECGPCAQTQGCAADVDCATGVCSAGGVCIAATCNDGQRNNGETGVDCGLAACDTTCPVKQGCLADTDCTSGLCDLGICVESHCINDSQDADESDVDCGGTDCRGCPQLLACTADSDCASDVCGPAATCVPAWCGDAGLSGDESDVDCGGPSCGVACALTQMCGDDTDCAAGTCVGGFCGQTHCTNTLQDADETDINCGGAGCGPCAVDDNCSVDGDCQSNHCNAGVCFPAHCVDGVLSGDESGVDCGGPTCGVLCADGESCSADTDCTSATCDPTAGLCVAASCANTTRDGDETDVDCGGSCAGCAPPGACVIDADCLFGTCLGGFCQADHCADGVQSFGERGVDCGGGECVGCADEAPCSADVDCASGFCDGWQCRPVTCDNGTQDAGEVGVDCGGSCLGCPGGTTCTANADCLSHDCTGACAESYSSCAAIKAADPSATTGVYTVNFPLEVEVWCDMDSDGGVGHTMTYLEDASLQNDQQAYRDLCASVGMEIIVPRTRDHAYAIADWLGQPPSVVGVYPQFNGANGLENWEGRCQGAPCSFWVSDTRDAHCGNGFEPNGDNNTTDGLHLTVADDCDFGRWNDGNANVNANYRGWVVCSTNDADPPLLSTCQDYLQADRVWTVSRDGITGDYPTNTVGTTITCDMLTDGGGWTLAGFSDFSGSTTIWTPSDIDTDCTGSMLGGPGNFGTGASATATYDVSAVAHTEARVELDYQVVDDWDGEQGRVFVDNSLVWFDFFDASLTDDEECGASFPNSGDIGPVPVSWSGAHTATSLTLDVTSTLDEAATNESFGVDNVEIWVR